MANHKLQKVKRLTSLWEQTKGLIGEAEPSEIGAGVALPNVNSIHTFFVRYPIDVIFLNPAGKVINLLTLKPFRISPIVFSARTTLELRKGSIESLKIKKGDSVEF